MSRKESTTLTFVFLHTDHTNNDKLSVFFENLKSLIDETIIKYTQSYMEAEENISFSSKASTNYSDEINIDKG